MGTVFVNTPDTFDAITGLLAGNGRIRSKEENMLIADLIIALAMAFIAELIVKYMRRWYRRSIKT